MDMQNNATPELNPDREVSIREEDLLDRYPIAEEFAKRIKNLPTKEGSYVIGIEGEWGSGKSSFINFIKTALNEKESDVVVYEFSPWRFSSEDDLVKKFFKDLASFQNKKLFTDKFFELWGEFEELLSATKDDRKRIWADANICMVVAFIGSWVTSTFPNLIGEMSKYASLALGGGATAYGIFSCIRNCNLHYKKKKEKRTLEQQKKELEKETANWPSKLLVVIDDIDRLTPSEIRAVIKLVKSQCDLPNIIYLLSYDKRQIASAYKEISKEDSGKFLDKIVQYEHRLPPLSTRKAQKYFIKLLKKHIPISEEEKSNLQYLFGISLFDENTPSSSELVFQHYLKNYREIVRFLNTLIFSSSSYIDGDWFERDLSDFVCIDLLKHYEPAVHSFIAGNKRLFTDGGGRRSSSSKDDIVDLKKQLEQLAVAPCAVDIVKKVFSRLSNSSGGNKGIRAENPLYFDSYFQMKQPECRVHRSTLVTLIQSATKDYHGVVSKIQEYANDNVWIALQVDTEFGVVDNVEEKGAYEFLKALVEASPRIYSESSEFYLTYSSIRLHHNDQTAVWKLLKMFILESRCIDASACLLRNSDEIMSEQTEAAAYELLLEQVAIADKRELSSCHSGSRLSFLQPTLEAKVPTKLVEFFETNLRQSPFIMPAFFGRNADRAQNAKWIVKNVSSRVINNWLAQVDIILLGDDRWGTDMLREAKSLIESVKNELEAV